MYLCYVDESGNLDCKQSANEKEKSSIFVLSAICVLDHKWPKFSGAIDRRKEWLKQKLAQTKGLLFNITDCELKSSWIRIPKSRKSRPFLNELSDEDLTGLVNLCYEQIDLAKMAIFAVIIDKQKLLPHFTADKLHRKAWELLIERVENYIRECHDRHKVIFIRDDISVQVNRSLAEKHAFLLKTQASSGLKLDHLIEMPLFVRSELSNGVQLADFVSYNFYHAFQHNKPQYPYLLKILPRVYNSTNTSAYKLDGIKVFPPESPLMKIAEEIESMIDEISF
ncbi:MAG TPA: DUF3800 domain-containing protein [bacterium]|nr:DUF3800 domain-containing protein [bacterium]